MIQVQQQQSVQREDQNVAQLPECILQRQRLSCSLTLGMPTRDARHKLVQRAETYHVSRVKGLMNSCSVPGLPEHR